MVSPTASMLVHFLKKKVCRKGTSLKQVINSLNYLPRGNFQHTEKRTRPGESTRTHQTAQTGNGQH